MKYYLLITSLILMANLAYAQGIATFNASGKINLKPQKQKCSLVPRYKIHFPKNNSEATSTNNSEIDSIAIKGLYSEINNQVANAITQIEDTSKVMYKYYPWLIGESETKQFLEGLEKLKSFTKNPFLLDIDMSNILPIQLQKMKDGLLKAKGTLKEDRTATKWLNRNPSDDLKFHEAIIYKRTLKARFLSDYIDATSEEKYDKHELEVLQVKQDSMQKRLETYNKAVKELANGNGVQKFNIDIKDTTKYKDVKTIEDFIKAHLNIKKVKNNNKYIVDLNFADKDKKIKEYVKTYNDLYDKVFDNDTLDEFKRILSASAKNWALASAINYMNPFMAKSEDSPNELKQKLEKFLLYKLDDHINYNKLSIKEYKELIDEIANVKSYYTINSVTKNPFLEDTIVLNRVKFPKKEKKKGRNTIHNAFDQRGKIGYWEKLLNKNIRTEETKRIYIYNVPNTHRISSSEQEADISKEVLFGDEGLISKLTGAINNADIQDLFSRLYNEDAKLSITKSHGNGTDDKKSFQQQMNCATPSNGSSPSTEMTIDIDLKGDLKLLTDELSYLKLLVGHFESYLSNPAISKEGKMPFYAAESDALSTYFIETSPIADAKQKNVTLWSHLGKDSSVYRKFSFKVGKPQRFAISLGGAYTSSKLFNYEYESTDSNVTIKNKTPYMRLHAGLHWYPWKQFLYDYSLLAISSGKFKERISVYGGLHVSKKPVDNFYLGLSYDILPGLKFISGMHASRTDRYTIINAKVASSKLHYSWYPFISLSVSLGASLTSLINLIGLL